MIEYLIRFNFTSTLSSAILLALFLITFIACQTTQPINNEVESIEIFIEDVKLKDQDRDSIDKSLRDASIDSILSTLTIEEKIGQLFAIRAFGEFENEKELSALRLEQLVKDYQIGGILFFRGDVTNQALLNNRLQTMSKLPLWISQDMEFGAAMRVNGATRFTPAMGIAATTNPENAYLAGLITAREAKALGVNQIFAPVLDVNNNPDNPVINVRSYSADPEIVSEYATQFMLGAESVGVLATGKHFPGHGDTNVDSHLALPTITHDYERLNSLELVPFRHAINSGIRSIMSAHISFPNISRNIGLPGTLDDSIVQDILIDSLGFDGLIVSDGLEMRGIADHHSPGEAVIMSLLAGVDLMLVSPDEITAINELIKAVDSGRINEKRLDHSVRKIIALKMENNLFENRLTDIDALHSQINRPEYQAIADRIGRESVTLLKNEKNIIPIRELIYPEIVLIAVSDGSGHPSATQLAREVRRYHSNVRFHSIDDRTSADEYQLLKNDAERAHIIVIGSFLSVRSNSTTQIPERQLNLLNEILTEDKSSVLMAFGNPYIIEDLPDSDVHLLAWSSSSDQVRQSVPALFGASTIQGRFPGSIPGMYDLGAGISIEQSVVRFDRPESAGLMIDSLMNIDTIMHAAINDSVFPGGAVGIMKNGALVWQETYGYHDYHKTRAVRSNDIFDLASVTKIMSTTSSIMLLVDSNLISLDDPIAKYIKEFDTDDKREITIRHFLLHTSGLPAYKIYVDLLKTRSEIVDAVRNEPLENKPGEKYVYSDLGFILLAEIVEIVTGKRVDQFIRDELFHPMGMHSTWFDPQNATTNLTERILPTEIDTVYQRGIVRAKVHDERAYFMDGIAGHAGLFSSIQDISKYAYMLLNNGFYGGYQYLSPEIIDYFTGPRSTINHRGLGFDRKSDGFSTAGQFTGDRTFGHLGFTGTSVWMDPDEDIAIILLTNRTYPNRSYGRRIGQIRALISDAVMNSIQK